MLCGCMLIEFSVIVFVMYKRDKSDCKKRLECILKGLNAELTFLTLQKYIKKTHTQ